jgi:hypothetical protein
MFAPIGDSEQEVFVTREDFIELKQHSRTRADMLLVNTRSKTSNRRSPHSRRSYPATMQDRGDRQTPLLE